MEQRQSSVVPLLLIIAMILAFVGVAAYYVVQNKKVLSAVEADSLITASMPPGVEHLGAVAEHRPRRSRPETPDDLRVGTRPNEDADDSGGR